VNLEQEATKVACLLEMNLPPSFFDIQPHLVVHLPKELLMAGPVRPRWCGERLAGFEGLGMTEGKA
jgi:hypothetical protein